MNIIHNRIMSWLATKPNSNYRLEWNRRKEIANWAIQFMIWTDFFFCIWSAVVWYLCARSGSKLYTIKSYEHVAPFEHFFTWLRSELNECAVVYLFFVHADGKTTPKPLKNRHFFFGLFQIIEVETQIITRWDLQQSSSCRPINVNVCLFEWAANVIYKIWVI